MNPSIDGGWTAKQTALAKKYDCPDADRKDLVTTNLASSTGKAS